MTPKVLDFHFRFSIRTGLDVPSLTFVDSLSPSTSRVVKALEISLKSRAERLAALQMLIPRCVENSPLPVAERPTTKTDEHFWQYPAITERLAFERHANLEPPEWQPEFAGPVNTYLGLPWATYIDKKAVPDDVRQVFRVRLRGYRALADEWGLAWGKDVTVHTVCQHIYWQRLLPLWAELGVTDLHLSHCEPASAALALSHGIRVHSWPLAAANVVNPDRCEGLVVGRPLAERKLLASFVGAHMGHYRSDVRLRLRDEAACDGGHDLLFELTDDWHFNPLVYGTQVAGDRMSDSATAAERAATIRYNEVLSDSVFALCPEGAGPNTLRLWEAMAVGAIPVVVVEDWEWPSAPAGGPGWDDAVIRVRRDQVGGLLDRLRLLRHAEPRRLVAMQAKAMALYEGFTRRTCF